MTIQGETYSQDNITDLVSSKVNYLEFPNMVLYYLNMSFVIILFPMLWRHPIVRSCSSKIFSSKYFSPRTEPNLSEAPFVLDCVANWDPESGTQEVPETWDEKVHGFKSRMNERSHTGDFIAVINRKDPDKHLAQKFAFYFENLNNPEFRLEMMPLNELQESRPNSSINMENFDFFRSDHYRFWYPSEETPSISLPALLLTDTAPYRGKMKQCYHEYCDNFETIKPNIKFLAKVIKATAWALADLAEGSCGPRGLFSIPELFDV
ncbi:hypothetical protein Avbf_06419, partial [Armadillidium vulgare]